MDFNIIKENSGKLIINHESMVEKAFSLGYECIALNTIISSTQLDTKGFKIPEPKDFSESETKKKRILNRVTAIIETTLQAHHFMQDPTIRKYDIIAVIPTDKDVLQHACRSMAVDIISFEFSSKRLSFTLKKSYFGDAIKKGICFEIQYSPCLRDRSFRRLTICNSQILASTIKGKNIILSSGAENPLELRGAKDVANLGILFGLKSNQAKDAVVKTGKTVLAHSETRRKTGCGFVAVQDLFKLAKKDKWLVEACKVPEEYNLSAEASNLKKRPRYEEDKKKDSKVTRYDCATDSLVAPLLEACKVPEEYNLSAEASTLKKRPISEEDNEKVSKVTRYE